jgi:hypothetical protein
VSALFRTQAVLCQNAPFLPYLRMHYICIMNSLQTMGLLNNSIASTKHINPNLCAYQSSEELRRPQLISRITPPTYKTERTEGGRGRLQQSSKE